MKVLRILVSIIILISSINAKEFKVGVFSYINSLETVEIYKQFF